MIEKIDDGRMFDMIFNEFEKTGGYMKRVLVVLVFSVSIVLFAWDFKSNSESFLDTSYQDSLNISTLSTMFSGAVRDICMKDSFAFIPSGYSLVIYKVNEQHELQYINKVAMPSEARCVTFGDTIVYVGCLKHICLISISDMSNPKLISANFGNYYNISALIVYDNILYAANGMCLQALSIDDPDSVWIIEEKIFSFVSDIFLDDSVLIAATGSFIYFYPVASLPLFQTIDSFFVYEPPFGLQVKDSILYAANYSLGLKLYDIGDYHSVSELGYLYLQSYAIELALEGDYAFVSTLSEGVAVVNVSDPFNLLQVNTIPVSSPGDNVCIYDSLLMAASYNGITLYDVVNDSLISFELMNRSPREIVLNGEYAYVRCGSNYLQIIDVSDPSNPFSCSEFPIYGDLTDYCINGDKLFYTTNIPEFGLNVLNISNPYSPSLLARYDSSLVSLAIFEDSGYVYSINENGLKILNATDVFSIYEEGSYSILCDPVKLQKKDSVLFVADEWRGLRIINVSDPANPSYMGHFLFYSDIRDMFLDGNHLYLADYNYDLIVLDVSNTDSIFIAGTCDLDKSFYRIYEKEGFVYASAGKNGVRILDVRNLASIEECGFYYTPGNMSASVLSNDNIYMADCISFIIAEFDFSSLGITNFVCTAPQKRLVFDIAENSLSFICETNDENLVLYDINGRSVLNRRGFSRGQVEIDLSELVNGIYFAHLTKNGISEQIKLLKLH